MASSWRREKEETELSHSDEEENEEESNSYHYGSGGGRLRHRPQRPQQEEEEEECQLVSRSTPMPALGRYWPRRDQRDLQQGTRDWINIQVWPRCAIHVQHNMSRFLFYFIFYCFLPECSEIDVQRNPAGVGIAAVNAIQIGQEATRVGRQATTTDAIFLP